MYITHIKLICCSIAGLNLGLKSLKTYTSNEGVYHADYSKYIEEQTLEGLAKLAKDVAKKSKALKKKLAQASLQKVRTEIEYVSELIKYNIGARACNASYRLSHQSL